MSANIASIANLKGGVGKSTTTVMLADGLAYFFGLNVLVVDLDSQANSSQVLLTEVGLDAAADQGKGAHEMLGQFVRGETPIAGPFIVPNAVSLEELRRAEERDDRLGWVSILPSHPKLRLAEMSLEEDWYSGPGTPSTLAAALTEHFRASVEPLLSLYDVILIDCPPHLSPLSRAALAASDSFVLPTLADPISTWGTKQFSDWVTDHVTADLAAQSFIVVTRFRNTAMARQIRADIQDVYLKDRYFGAVIPDSVSVLKAMDRPSLDSYNTFRGKYGSVTGDVRRLAQRYADFMQIRTGTAWKMVRQ
ncbi:MAG: ParA family protein [Pseudomonadota bacterium]